ncbi:MAG: hypothetical protein U9R68_04520, partial [Planctomycetota bacterium]|nr:hypothetical protein [Planctomycetota bacterium]
EPRRPRPADRILTMKSRRRHELRTNELADALGRLVERVRPHAQTVAIIVGVAIIGVVVLVSLPIMRSRAAADAAYAFNAAVRAGGPEALRTFLDGYTDADQGSTARLLLADRLLRSVAAGDVDTDDAEATLDEAEAFYAQVAKASKDLEPMARTGLALVTLQRGDLDEGRKALEQVTERWPQSVAAARAKSHLEALAGYEPVAFSDEPLEEPPAPGETPPESAEEAVPAAPAAGPPAETPPK